MPARREHEAIVDHHGAPPHHDAVGVHRLVAVALGAENDFRQRRIVRRDFRRVFEKILFAAPSPA
jgi:hypothetical protein